MLYAGRNVAYVSAWVKSEFEERNKTLMTREAILKIEEERLIKEKQRLTGRCLLARVSGFGGVGELEPGWVLAILICACPLRLTK